VLHHVGLEVSDLQRSASFYDALLGPLGWRRHLTQDDAIGWGINKPVFFLTARNEPRPGFGHVCFKASGMAGVKAAWEAGVAAGGTSDGAPGARPQYGSRYYSAYVLDPDGYSLEIAVGLGD
jgi:catechol 2,3-dioxygenase-like lactoylglutathione lyase family enzyme